MNQAPVPAPMGAFGIMNEMRTLFLESMRTKTPNDKLFTLCEQLKDRIESLNARYQKE